MKTSHRSKPAPKLTDDERRERFIEMAREVEASEDGNAFDSVFGMVVVIDKPQPKND